MMSFLWILTCPQCETAFEPLEEDWDGPVKCRRCGHVDKISHENYDLAADELEAEPELPN